jgi:mannose-1-phosphate guanylyltransferase
VSFHAVVMAGGSGTRFWPLSRLKRPKQFLPLTGHDALIVETVKRLGKVPAATWVVCGRAHAPQVKKLLKKAAIVVEPQARNTAPAIALATLHVAAADPEAVIAVLPSDQHVANVPAFQRVLAQAAAVAEQGLIVTLGITPTRPDTGYGYIRVGEAMEGGARRVAKFVEKPDLTTAEQYLASGEYLWNAGMFVFQATTMLAAFEKHMPELHAALKKIALSLGTKHYQKDLERQFSKMPATSIDYGVAERADNIAVVPGSFGWSDVGSFNALADVRKVDDNGNVLEGQAIALRSSGCVLLGQQNRPLAVIGMKDTVVVDAGDAVLVVPKGNSQDVKLAVEYLKKNKKLTKYL